MSGETWTGNWKITLEDGQVLLKVVGFPTPEDGFAESMWVRSLCGTDLDGVGSIENTPMMSDLRYGDLIVYGDGSETEKPQFVCTLVGVPADAPFNVHLFFEDEVPRRDGMLSEYTTASGLTGGVFALGDDDEEVAS